MLFISRHRFAIITIISLLVIILSFNSVFFLESRVHSQQNQKPLDPCLHSLSAISEAIPPVDVVLLSDLSEKNPRHREFLTLMRSLIFMSSCPLRLHFIGDTSTNAYIKSLNLAHNNSSPETFFHDLPSDHGIKSEFREQVATRKVFLHEAMPGWVEHALFLDFDMIVLHDICAKYHEELDKFSSETALAISPNDSDWYHKIHPDHGYQFQPTDDVPPGMAGLNTGMFIAHLRNMREMGWTQKILDFYQKLEHDDPGAPHFPLGDQDIINRYLRDHPEQVHVLSQNWNWQRASRDKPLPYDLLIYHGNLDKFQHDRAVMKNFWFMFAPDEIKSYRDNNDDAHDRCTRRRKYADDPKSVFDLVQQEANCKQ